MLNGMRTFYVRSALGAWTWISSVFLEPACDASVSRDDDATAARLQPGMQSLPVGRPTRKESHVPQRLPPAPSALESGV